jgi:hypothetical protein
MIMRWSAERRKKKNWVMMMIKRMKSKNKRVKLSV